ncbi:MULTISPECIES: hypothetical protein [unclassified Streptomyces]|uniref:hypothetical protein n=1 Tax=unclassified Streptomyces TaxID=2593676 RepID=UPI000A3E47A4|nr:MULTISPECIES: hypothetical protein [unclassified Streptomyces]
MRKRRVRRMVAELASGEPVNVRRHMTTLTGLAELAALAEPFGYEYAGLTRETGLQGNTTFTLHLVPDPRRPARERAAQSWAAYPQAAERGPLPPVPAQRLDMLKARVRFDLTAQMTDRQRTRLAFCMLAFWSLLTMLRLHGSHTALVVIVVVWVVLVPLIPYGIRRNHRVRARYAAILDAAGYVRTTDAQGLPRYLLPGGRHPGRFDPS